MRVYAGVHTAITGLRVTFKPFHRGDCHLQSVCRFFSMPLDRNIVYTRAQNSKYVYTLSESAHHPRDE